MNLAAASIIAETKLMPPRHREGMVVRQELDEVLRASDAPLVVVSGPAGSGKSVLLAHWHHAETTASWKSFDDADNDPNWPPTLLRASSTSPSRAPTGAAELPHRSGDRTTGSGSRQLLTDSGSWSSPCESRWTRFARARYDRKSHESTKGTPT